MDGWVVLIKLCLEKTWAAHRYRYNIHAVCLCVGKNKNPCGVSVLLGRIKILPKCIHTI